MEWDWPVLAASRRTLLLCYDLYCVVLSLPSFSFPARCIVEIQVEGMTYFPHMFSLSPG